MSEDQKRSYVTDGIQQEVEKPQRIRSEITNRRGKTVIPRKYHMTKKQEKNFRDKFDKATKRVSKDIKEKAGKRFMNTYREAGIYYGCIQSLYLLGSNEWHDFLPILKKLQVVMSGMEDKNGRTAWGRFSSKCPRMVDNQVVMTARDLKGRIEQNMRVLQRLGGLHPYGLKLMQVGSCIDVRRTKEGKYEYRLRTNISGDIVPILDLSAYPQMKRGKKVTSKVVLKENKVEEVSV
jgi:hypothetical protein